MPGPFRKLAPSLGAIARLLVHALSPRRSASRVVLKAYRGYGSPEECFLIGRAFQERAADFDPPGEVVRRELVELVRRFLRRGIADARIIARFYGTEQTVRTDRDGYFRIHIRPTDPLPRDRRWHRMELEMSRPGGPSAEAELFVPPENCRRVVISDIDDTVIDTGVANKLRMLWRLFMQGAASRVAFPGMAALLRAIHLGASGTELNPMLYVSRGPWSIYEVLDEFFRQHAIPVGPVLFLREWGITLQSPLPRRAEGHKLSLIRHMLALYRDLPCILIGDSGQRDPEIYAQIVREHPGRVEAIYIRNVSRDAARLRAIEELALEVVQAGSVLLLAADSMAMARHAAGCGWIAPGALAEVLGEKTAQEPAPDVHPTREVERPGAAETQAAVRRGELAEALETVGRGGAPPNVVVQIEDGDGIAPAPDDNIRGRD